MNLADRVRQAGAGGAGREVIAKPGVVASAIVISHPYPEVYREVI